MEISYSKFLKFSENLKSRIDISPDPATGARAPAIGGNRNPHVKPAVGQQRSMPKAHEAGELTTATWVNIRIFL